MSNFGGDSSVNMDQEFFDSGFSYEGQPQPGESFSNGPNYSGQTFEPSNNYYHYNSNFDPSSSSQTPAQTQSLYGNGQSFGSYYESPSSYGGSGQIDYGFSGSMQAKQTSADYTSFEDEPPLMEELGINFEHIWQKTVSVMNPLQQTDSNIMDDTDLAGPLVFCLAFGGFLLLSGKVHGFGYIYGVGVLGCLAMYSILNLMSMTGVSVSLVVSVLGYCLLPMVMLSSLSTLFSLQGMIGTVLTAVTIGWCSLAASKLFVIVLAMDAQQLLVAYPCALLYGVFALLTVF